MAKKRTEATDLKRPLPPETLVEAGRDACKFEPAPALEKWIREAFLEPGGVLVN